MTRSRSHLYSLCALAVGLSLSACQGDLTAPDAEEGAEPFAPAVPPDPYTEQSQPLVHREARTTAAAAVLRAGEEGYLSAGGACSESGCVEADRETLSFPLYAVDYYYTNTRVNHDAD